MSTSNDKYEYNGKGTQNYNLIIDKEGINISGDFYKIINREILQSNVKEEHIPFNGYLGMSQLAIRSEKKLNYPIYLYLGFSVIKFVFGIIEKILGYKEIASNVINNNYKSVISSYVAGAVTSLIPIPISISFIDILFCIVQVLGILLIINYFFSKKSIYEITSTDKRIGFDKSTMTKTEFLEMCKFAEKMKEMNR